MTQNSNISARVAIARDEVFLETGFDLSEAIRSDEDAIRFLQSIEDPALDTLDDGYIVTTRYCKRCGGSGHYSYNQMTGTICFQCDNRPSRREWQSKEAVKSYAQGRKRSVKARARQQAKRDAELQARWDTFNAFMSEAMSSSGEELARALDSEWIERHFDEAAFESDVPKALHILRDLRQKAFKFGSLSAKQIELALRLYDQIQNPSDHEEATVDAPEGRQEFTGQIVSVKLSQGHFGDSVRMTVKVQAEGGVWLANGTLPTAVYDQAEQEIGSTFTDSGCREITVGDVRRHLYGREITLTATLTPAKDAHFAFAKRPSKAQLAEL